jgi:PHP family Zn ribbon phosphoesterase
VSIVSFSDAHSLPKLGRELTVFRGEPTYDGLMDSLRNQGIEYTLEMFPEEGKYHHAGHRKCGVRLSPREFAANGERCTKCGRKLTSRVMQRIEELAGRTTATHVDGDGLIHGDAGRPPFRTMVSLRQIVSEALGRGLNTKTVTTAYHKLVHELDGELRVLTESSPSATESIEGERVAEGVVRARTGNVSISPGFDGEYGRVSIWPKS